MSDRAKTKAQEAMAYSQRQVDRVVSPPTRQKAYDSTAAFATERPIFFSFLLAQVLFCFLPLLFFFGFAASTAFVSLLSAVVFTLFLVGLATLSLVPALFVASGLALLVWVWAVATFLAGRWVYHMLPEGLRSDLKLRMPNGKEVIFQKEQPNGVDNSKKSETGNAADLTDDIKAEAAEVRD
ncbi:hypothetical protein F4778DRAFT_774736 [Xylariomycetidae sp. FL2044]|nr:hypothetical protein F4778DRAFT_774736 [Xylariomycetidae sp. FL2044]